MAFVASVSETISSMLANDIFIIFSDLSDTVLSLSEMLAEVFIPVEPGVCDETA